jgi:hypothetical protein
VDLREKVHAAGASWGTAQSLLWGTESTSAGTLGTLNLLGTHRTRLYLYRYLE